MSKILLHSCFGLMTSWPVMVSWKQGMSSQIGASGVLALLCPRQGEGRFQFIKKTRNWNFDITYLIYNKNLIQIISNILIKNYTILIQPNSWIYTTVLHRQNSILILFTNRSPHIRFWFYYCYGKNLFKTKNLPIWLKAYIYKTRKEMKNYFNNSHTANYT